MRIVNLIEDTAGDSGYIYQHGLSFYIETERHRVLFDTGADGSYIENAKKKGIDLSLADIAVISHGHYDHTGGILAFREINKTARIYVRENAFGEFYSLKSSEPKYIGADPKIKELDLLVLTDGDVRIDRELFLFTNISGRQLWPLGNEVLREKKAGEYLQDGFSHEQCLAVFENDKRILISGCAHNGILNILSRYYEIFCSFPTDVISGFHTVKKEYTDIDDSITANIAKELAKTDATYYSGHCTGEHAMAIMKDILGDKLVVLHSGDEVINNEQHI